MTSLCVDSAPLVLSEVPSELSLDDSDVSFLFTLFFVLDLMFFFRVEPDFVSTQQETTFVAQFDK